MKKHLIAAAVAAAVAVPAMAQNVSIGGYIEQGLTNTRSNDGTATTNKIGSGPFGSSRMAITGSEDLGGGMKASFRLEMSLNTTTGNGGATVLENQTLGAGLFNRGADFGLSGAFGTVKIGKMDHPGIEGNEVGTALVGNIALFDTAVEGISDKGSASDANNTIIYSTPVIGGATVTVGYTGKNDGANAASGYTHEGIMSAQISGTYSGITYKLGQGTVKAASGGAKHKYTGGGVSYNFGIASVGIQHQVNNIANDANDSSETILTALVPLSNGFDLRLSHNSYDLQGGGNSDATKTSVGFGKALSKRTSLLGLYRAIDNGGTTADTKELGVYLAHTF